MFTTKPPRSFELLKYFLLPVALICCAPGGEAPASAEAASEPAVQQNTPPLKEFVVNDQFLLELDGKIEKEALVYHSQKPPAWLVVTPALPQAMVLRPVDYELQTLEHRELTADGDEVLRVAPNAKADSAGRFTVVNSTTVTWKFAGRDVRLVAKPHLLGLQDAKALRDYGVLWEKRTQAYRADAQLIQEAAAFSDQARVTVFFGSWCQHCQRKVPGLLGVEEELEGSGISFEYYGLPPGFAGEPEAEKNKITLIPTAIVRVGGREIGRIENKQWDKPEARLVEILSAGK